MPRLAPFRDEDYPALVELTRESIEPLGGADPELDLSDDEFKSMIAAEDSTTLVMWDDDAMAAYVTFYPRDDHMFINWLVVHPDYRNRGFATMLLDEVGRSAAQRHLRSLQICLQEDNRLALALCEAAGFRRLAHDPMGWVMEKEVVPERPD